MAVVSSAQKTWSKKGSISLHELSELPLIWMHRQKGIHCHDMVMDEMRRMNLTPNVFCESDSVSAILSLVDRNLGIAILPASALSLQPEGRYHCMAISECALQSSSAVLWRKEKRLSAAARLFLNMF